MGHLPTGDSRSVTIGNLSADDLTSHSWGLTKKRKWEEIAMKAKAVGDFDDNIVCRSKLCAAKNSSRKRNVAKLLVVSDDEGDRFIDGLGLALAILAQTQARPCKMARLHSIQTPSRILTDYIKHLRSQFGCSDECFVMALVYLDRIANIDPQVTVSNLAGRHMLAVAVMLAAKFHDEVYFANSYYANMCGLRVSDANALEARLLQMLDWKVCVSLDEYELYYSLVVTSSHDQ